MYACVMLAGTFTVRVPMAGWQPSRCEQPPRGERADATAAGLGVTVAVRTRQFWLIWVMLCVNVTAGIGVLGQASAMIQ